MTGGPGPDESISGQPYSAPRQARAGYDDGHNYLPPQSYLPPPQPSTPIHPPIWGINAPEDPAVQDPMMGGGTDTTGGKKRSWFARHKILTGLLAAAALLLLVIIAAATGSGQPTPIAAAKSSAAAVTAVPPAPKPSGQDVATSAPAPSRAAPKPPALGWHAVTALSGSGNKRSPVFTIGEHRTRLRYTVTDTSGIDAALVAVYVLDEGTSLNQDGGFPEVTAQGGSDSTELANGPGTYYLDVSAANARWSVTVEELR